MMNEHAFGIVSETKEIRLLDGRRISLNITGKTTVSSDIKSHLFDFSWFRREVPWHTSLRDILIALLSTHSTTYAHTCSYYVARFINDIFDNNGELSTEFRLVYLQTWVDRYGIASWAIMQAVLGRWVRSGLPGLAQDVVDFLTYPEKWEEKANGAYFALVANDPERGAFTEQELKNIQEGVNRVFQLDRITVRDWALVWFLIGTGVRPVQIARMRFGDVLINEGPEGKEITLAIPMAKGENAVSKDRWKRKAPSVLADVLFRYFNSIHADSKDAGEPLFFDQSRKISAQIAAAFSRVKTYSDRLHRPIPIYPYRFRYTFGTRALALGASDHEVARLLTHRTTWCVQFYRAAMPTLQKPIKDAVGLEMEFIALAFQGRLIGGLDEAIRRGEAAALIRDFAHLMGQSIGACGTRAECHQDAPRACLGCMKFEPFSAAPWEDLLRILTEDMAAETEDRIKLITLGQIEAIRGIIAERDAAGSRA